jgi:hypothetical protein
MAAVVKHAARYGDRLELKADNDQVAGFYHAIGMPEIKDRPGWFVAHLSRDAKGGSGSGNFGDTLLALKRRSFLDLRPSHFRRVRATTHAPLAKGSRSTIL